MSSVAVPCLATVAEDFEGEEGELSLTQGTQVIVVKCDDDGWWTVHTKNTIGIFPGSYLDVAEVIKLPCNAKINKNFKEMNLNVGEIVQVQDISEEGWMIESKSNLGFCTWDYLDIVKDVPKPAQPQNTPPQQQQQQQRGPPGGQQRPPQQMGGPGGQPQQLHHPPGPQHGGGQPQQRPPQQMGGPPNGSPQLPRPGGPGGPHQQRPPQQMGGPGGPHPQQQLRPQPAVGGPHGGPPHQPHQQQRPPGGPQPHPPGPVGGSPQGSPQPQRPPQQHIGGPHQPPPGPQGGSPQQKPPQMQAGPQGGPPQQRPPSQLNPSNQRPPSQLNNNINTPPMNRTPSQIQPKPQNVSAPRADSANTGTSRSTLFKKKQSILNLPDPVYRFSGFNINSDISELHGRKDVTYDPYLMPDQRNAPKFEQDGRWEFRAFKDLPPPPPFKDLPKEYVSGSMASYIDWKAKERSAVFDI